MTSPLPRHRHHHQQRLYIAVSGASRGLGRAIAMALCHPNNINCRIRKNEGGESTTSGTTGISRSTGSPLPPLLPTTTHINAVFLARSETGLQELTQQILHQFQGQSGYSTTVITNENRTNIIPTIDAVKEPYQVHTKDHVIWSAVPTDQNESTNHDRTTTTSIHSTKIATMTMSHIAADLGNVHTIDSIIDRTLQRWDEPSIHHESKDGNNSDGTSNEPSPPIEPSPQQQPSQLEHRYIFINNVGSLGHVGSCDTYTSVHDMHTAMTLNVTNALWFTTRIVQWMKQKQQHHHHMMDDALLHLTIVNISSLVAVQSFPSLATYSAGKAARDMYHNALAKEEEEFVNDGNVDKETTDNNIAQEQEREDLVASETHQLSSSSQRQQRQPKLQIRILNYAPGPLQTDMTTELQNQTSVLHPSIRPFYNKTDTTTNTTSSFIDPIDSANVLMKLLRDDTYTNGAHVDYYDCR